MSDYKDTISYWGNVFNKVKARILSSEKSGYEAIDLALDWLSKETTTILDFGCGSGALLAYLAKRKAGYYYGIDLSENAIALAKELFKQNNLEQGIFIHGSVEKLKTFDEGSIDGVILSNLLDNVIPTDALNILNEVDRLLKKDGKLFIKLNAYFNQEDIKEAQFKRIEEDFYLEPSGLYLWNKPNHYWLDLLTEKYKLIKEEKVFFEPHNFYNRLFCFTKK